MDESDIADELANLRAENMALVERLGGSPEMREVISELRRILDLLAIEDAPKTAKAHLRALLRRLDES